MGPSRLLLERCTPYFHHKIPSWPLKARGVHQCQGQSQVHWRKRAASSLRLVLAAWEWQQQEGHRPRSICSTWDSWLALQPLDCCPCSSMAPTLVLAVAFEVSAARILVVWLDFRCCHTMHSAQSYFSRKHFF